MNPITFDTHMTSNVIFKYLMRHTYTSPMGIIGLLAGFGLIAAFLSGKGSPIYLAGGILVLLYLPVSLFMTAKRQVRLNPAFKKPLTYTLTEDDLTVSQGEEGRSVEWSSVVKTVFTKSMIIVYTSRVNAWIFPRRDLGPLEKDVETLIRRKTGHNV